MSFIYVIQSFAQQITIEDSFPLEQFIQGGLGKNFGEITTIVSTVNSFANEFQVLDILKNEIQSFLLRIGLF
jgi:hypothetical protein